MSISFRSELASVKAHDREVTKQAVEAQKEVSISSLSKLLGCVPSVSFGGFNLRCNVVLG